MLKYLIWALIIGTICNFHHSIKHTNLHNKLLINEVHLFKPNKNGGISKISISFPLHFETTEKKERAEFRSGRQIPVRQKWRNWNCSATLRFLFDKRALPPAFSIFKNRLNQRRLNRKKLYKIKVMFYPNSHNWILFMSNLGVFLHIRGFR